jgi:hypothetical protein
MTITENIQVFSMRIAPLTPVYKKTLGNNRKSNQPTAKQRKAWEEIRKLGCSVCGESNPQIHHCFTGGGGRKDHDKIIPLCEYHHVGAMGIHTLGRKKWQAEYGSEEELLIKAERLLVMTDSF